MQAACAVRLISPTICSEEYKLQNYRLNDFLTLPAVLTYIDFAISCLDTF